jgi:sugar phosphate isomerase/epimerase
MSVCERRQRLRYRPLPDRGLPRERYTVWCQSVPLRLHERLTLFQSLRRVRHWPPVIAEFESHSMNPVGVNSWVWVSPPSDATIPEIAPRVKAMGFELLEMGVENPRDWNPARVAEILAANDLRASVCAVMGEGRDLLERDLIASAQEYIRTCIDAAVTVGSDVVAGPVYTPTGKTWRMDDAQRAAAVDRLVEGLRPLADYAGERGVRLAIEPLNRFETSFLNTGEQTMEVVDRIDSRRSGCCSIPFI